MFRSLALLALTLLLLVSCQITQEYSFKKDFSGFYKMTFDLSGLDDLQDEESTDSIPDYFYGFNADSVENYFNGLEGIRKTKAKTTENQLHLSYKFDDLDALNTSLSSEGANLGIGSAPLFSLEDGVFRYQFKINDLNDSIAEALQFFDYDVVMKFAKPVISHNNGKLLENGKGINMKGNLGEVAKGKKSLSVTVKFD